MSTSDDTAGADEENMMIYANREQVEKIMARARVLVSPAYHAGNTRITTKHYVSPDGEVLIEDITLETV